VTSYAPSQIQFRGATLADSDMLLRWRNDSDAVLYSRSGQPVGVGSHYDWIKARLLCDPTRLWIAEHAGIAVGVLRFDVEKDAAMVSIAVAPDHRRAGHALAMLRILPRLVEGDAKVSRLIAEVHPNNAASLRTFARAGFRSAGASDGFLVLEWP
jgi:RimJ/RimL family protein N-acetyltransferase